MATRAVVNVDGTVTQEPFEITPEVQARWDANAAEAAQRRAEEEAIEQRRDNARAQLATDLPANANAAALVARINALSQLLR